MITVAPPNRIREWRNRRRLSLANLGEIVGLSRSELSKLENGSRRVRTDHLITLSKALRVTPDDLMDKNTVRDIVGDPVHSKAVPPLSVTIPIAQAKRVGQDIQITHLDLAPKIDAPPQLPENSGGYAFYMPDTSFEPKIPIGSLLYVNPQLPPRDGDLAIITLSKSIAVLVSIHRSDKEFVALSIDHRFYVTLGDETIESIHRVMGMMFP